MRTIHQQLEPTHHGLTTTELPVRQIAADPAMAYADEVRSLRQRVVLLEVELAAAKAAQVTSETVRPSPPLTSIDFAPVPDSETHQSQFTESTAPAVQSAAACEASVDVAQGTSEPGFAQAWTAENENVTFEERIAEKAFFQASTVDEESRSWLLDK